MKRKIKKLEDELLWYKTQSSSNYTARSMQTTDSPGQSSLPGSARSSNKCTQSSSDLRNQGRIQNPAKSSFHPQGPWDGIEIGTARSPNSSWYGPSSLFHFIGRMNTHLGAILQQKQISSELVLHGSASTLLNGTTDTNAEEHPSQQVAISVEDPLGPEKFLSATQEAYFLEIFWKTYHACLFPIINEAEFMDHYRSLWVASGDRRSPSALVDIVIALCMQYGTSNLTPEQRRSVIDGDASVAGRWYFQRCQQLVTYQLESPTISTVQSLIFCCKYLCNGSFLNMSATWCTLAVSAAYVVGLHVAPSQTLPAPERELRSRIWWALYEQDAKIGMKLGRTFLTRRSLTEPMFPDDNNEAAQQSGSHFAPLGGSKTWLSFHLYSSKLFVVAREIHEVFYAQEVNVLAGKTIWENPNALESHAEFLQLQTRRLDQWVEEVPPALKTSRQENGIPFSTDGSKIDIEPFAPVWLQHQRLNLELIYHTLCTNIHRPFISFHLGPTSDLTEKLSTKSAVHAMTLTNILHQTLSTTTILNGWHETFQWQWNASMTMVGFVMAHPRSEQTAELLRSIEVSISVCEMLAKGISVAASAAKILRNLGPKINFLLLHHPGVPITNTEESMAVDDATKSTVNPEWFDNLMSEDTNLHGSLMMPMQNMFQMAYSIEQWSALDSLFPGIDSDNWEFPALGTI